MSISYKYSQDFKNYAFYFNLHDVDVDVNIGMLFKIFVMDSPKQRNQII